MSLHIAAVGDWTRSLYQLVKEGRDDQASRITQFWALPMARSRPARGSWLTHLQAVEVLERKSTRAWCQTARPRPRPPPLFTSTGPRGWPSHPLVDDRRHAQGL